MTAIPKSSKPDTPPARHKGHRIALAPTTRQASLLAQHPGYVWFAGNWTLDTFQAAPDDGARLSDLDLRDDSTRDQGDAQSDLRWCAAIVVGLWHGRCQPAAFQPPPKASLRSRPAEGWFDACFAGSFRIVVEGRDRLLHAVHVQSLFRMYFGPMREAYRRGPEALHREFGGPSEPCGACRAAR